MSIENEQRYYDSLRRITAYMTPAQLRRQSGREYGLEYEESLEYAYENVIQEAHNALRGRRRPKLPKGRPDSPDVQPDRLVVDVSAQAEKEKTS